MGLARVNHGLVTGQYGTQGFMKTRGHRFKARGFGNSNHGLRRLNHGLGAPNHGFGTGLARVYLPTNGFPPSVFREFDLFCSVRVIVRKGPVTCTPEGPAACRIPKPRQILPRILKTRTCFEKLSLYKEYKKPK